jgi:hypothetical protein
VSEAATAITAAKRGAFKRSTAREHTNSAARG